MIERELESQISQLENQMKHHSKKIENLTNENM